MSPLDRLAAARRATAEGRHADALREHVRFHEEVPAADSAYHGVRLSHALADWVELGKHYPDALTTLRSLRDRAAERLLRGAGTRELFCEVAAIDGHLGETAHTHSLFRRLAETAPELAHACGSIALPILMAVGDLEFAGRFLPDLEREIRALANATNARVLQLHDRKHPVAAKDPARKSRMLDVEVDLYSEEVHMLMRVLRHAGRHPEAEQLRTDALALLADGAIRDKVGLRIDELG